MPVMLDPQEMVTFKSGQAHTHYGTAVYSASSINEYQIFMWVKHGRCVRLATSPPSVIQLSTQSGILNISQSYSSPWSVREIASLLCLHLLYSIVLAGHLERFYVFVIDLYAQECCSSCLWKEIRDVSPYLSRNVP
jgi:hypothetical protein